MAYVPSALTTYLEILPTFQAAITASSDSALGKRITSGESLDETELPEQRERRVAMQTVARLVRDRRFRTQVTRAYEGKCGFCGIGLGLIDAAHVRAVSDDGPDTISNGICACPTHHRAFDHGLLVLDDDLAIRVNQHVVGDRGFDEDEVQKLESRLFEKLNAPTDREPAAEFMAHHRAKWHAD